MAQQNKQVDVESLQDGGGRRRRGGCLDVFIVLSILVLFVAVTAVAVCGVMVVNRLRSDMQTSRQPSEYQALKSSGEATTQSYKMQNFVYLEPISSKLELNSTMRLAPVHHLEGTSVGSNFNFDPEEHSLSPLREGTYFMYIDLHLSCTHQCRAGLLSVQVGDKLTCEVHLPSDKRLVKRRCWTVAQVDKQKLLTQITVPKGGLPNWELEVISSGLGMFLVD